MAYAEKRAFDPNAKKAEFCELLAALAFTASSGDGDGDGDG